MTTICFHEHKGCYGLLLRKTVFWFNILTAPSSFKLAGLTVGSRYFWQWTKENSSAGLLCAANTCSSCKGIALLLASEPAEARGGKGKARRPFPRTCRARARTCLQGDVESLAAGERLDAQVVPGPGLQAPQGAAVGAVSLGGGLAAGRLPVLGAPAQAEVAGAARGAPAQPNALPGDAPLRQVGAASRLLPRRGLRRAETALRDRQYPRPQP